MNDYDKSLGSGIRIPVDYPEEYKTELRLRARNDLAKNLMELIYQNPDKGWCIWFKEDETPTWDLSSPATDYRLRMSVSTIRETKIEVMLPDYRKMGWLALSQTAVQEIAFRAKSKINRLIAYWKKIKEIK